MPCQHWDIFWVKPKFNTSKNGNSFSFTVNIAHVAIVKRLKAKAIVVKEFAQANNYNTGYCLMAVMSLAYGDKRFFVYNLTIDSIELAGLVAHGSGRGRLSTRIEF